MIRPFRPEDDDAVSALLHEEVVPHPVTAAGVRHWHEGQPARARVGSWVAVDEERVVGFGRSRLRWSTSVAGVGDVWVFVAPAARRRGVGAALYERTENHAREVGARVLETWAYTPAGSAFAAARGFRATATERISLLEPALADTSALPELEAAMAADGFRLAPLRDVFARAADLHRVYAAASADVPEYFREDDVGLEEWRAETLAHPQLSRDGSFVVLAGDVPASLAFVEVDEPAGLAANQMTGTLPEFRRRGLARLAKLATIRWAAENGVSAILTGNAEANVGMLRLNESLGYRPVETETQFVRDDLS